MKTATKFYEILYVSTMAPDAPLSVVGDIAAHARIANASRDISGVLVFDGVRFCQQIEGKQKDVLALMERMYQDTRHFNVEVFHHGPLAERRFSHFSVAFADVDEVAVLEQLEQLDGQAGVDAFTALIATLNLQA
jgi:Sensors of blue-light using FAD